MRMEAVAAFGCLLLMTQQASGGTDPPSPFGMVDHPDNTRHLDPGIATSPHKDAFPFFPSRASTAGRQATSDQFEPPEVCGGCHGEIYTQWNGSMHSNAWTDPVYRAALNLVSAASGGKVDNFCMGCHTPIGVVTREATPTAKGMSAVAERGVQCEVCHNISRSSGIGNGSYVLTPRLHGRPLQFGPFDDAVSPYHDTAYSKLHTQSEFCGQCHDVTHPFSHVALERTYSEWRDSSYAGEGVQCQDCHMKPKRGSATNFSKERERIYTHVFVGGNALVPKLLGSEWHSRQAEEMLRSAARVEIVPGKEMLAGQTNAVRIRVQNVGAGHKLPTGFPEGREMWLDFKVVGMDGAVLYRLGAVKEGRTEPGTESFRVVLGDKNNNVVDLNILDADRILYDTRIEPRGFRDVWYRVELPRALKGRVRLVAELNYWSFSPALLHHLMGSQAPPAHITLMASAQVEVPVNRSMADLRSASRGDSGAHGLQPE
jgi:hypothetical protein